MSNLKIDCKACNQEKTMSPTKICKMSAIVVFIGWLFVLPSIIGVVFSAIILFSSITAGHEVVSQAASNAEATGAAIGTGIGVGVSMFTGFFSLVGVVIGYLLIMKKKVYKCVSCGFIMDRD